MNEEFLDRFEKIAFLFMVFVWGIIFATIVMWHSSPSINCPQEDSCYADYYDGAWHIIERQP